MANTTPTYKEAKRLHQMGWAIHWLHPRSKRPIGDGWATGPRKSWDELKSSYQPDLNVGVRLGQPSHLKNGYLCVIDVDIKSEDKRHAREARAALAKLVGDAVMPEVRSGRGNGSRHLYCVTERPFKTWNPFESEETVRVMMPSKGVSGRERKEFSAEELKAGWRLSRAWEISLYSDGRQVVLPPSIHPDTLKPYFWKNEAHDVGSLPLFKPPVHEEQPEGEGEALAPRLAQETVEDFKCDETLDVRWLPMDEATRKLIVDGIWKGVKVDDRSAFLPLAATGLFSSGLDKNGVLTVLTDRSTYLGECAFDHAQTKSRKRAAKWVWNYTVKKIMHERDPSHAFKGKAVVTDRLDKEEASVQSDDIEEGRAWKDALSRNKDGQIKNTFINCQLVIVNSLGEGAVIQRNEFANNDFYLVDSPWRSKKGAAVTDVDKDRIKEYCAKNFGVEFHDTLIEQVLRVIADSNRTHPVREYIRGVKWDGVPRLDNWLIKYAEAQGPKEYVQAVSRKVVVALVKRVFEPGCKFDHVLILEGLQGAGKSTLLRNLVGDAWFTDQPLVIGEKDTVLTMQSKWLVELGELSSLNRSEVESMKAFITQTTDRIRSPYGRRTEDFPRQCIFVGSTNLDEYLKDETGNRRFWPVKVGAIDFEAIKTVRDQLIAEAYAFYLLGEPLYLETETLNLLAKSEQESRGEGDEWEGLVRDIVSGPIFPRGGFELRQVAKSMDGTNANKLEKSDQMRIARILKKLGFEKFRQGHENKRIWREILPTSKPNLPTYSEVGSPQKTPMIADFY